MEDSGLLQMPNTLSLFMVMLMKAVYKPCRIGTAELDRGQLSAGVNQLSEWTGLSVQSVRTGLKHLHSMNIITSKSTNKYTVYAFVNYNEYQDTDTLPNKPLTNDQQTTNKPLTTKEEGKKERKKEIIHSDEFLKFWEAWPSSPRKGGKSSCYKVWNAKHLDNEITVILSHIQLCKTNCVWKDPQYISAPLVYLNQSKWDGAESVDANKPFDINNFMKSQS